MYNKGICIYLNVVYVHFWDRLVLIHTMKKTKTSLF